MADYILLHTGEYRANGTTYPARFKAQIDEEVAAGESTVTDYVPTIDDYTNEIEMHLNEEARALGYDSLDKAMGYVGDPHQQFNDEAVALRNWRSAIWLEAIAIFNDVQAGNRAAPTNIISELTPFPGVV